MNAVLVIILASIYPGVIPAVEMPQAWIYYVTELLEKFDQTASELFLHI